MGTQKWVTTLSTSFFIYIIKHNIWEIIFGSFYFTGLDRSNTFRFGLDSVLPWTVETLSMFTLQNSGECLQTKENEKGNGKSNIAVMPEGRWKRWRPVTFYCVSKQRRRRRRRATRRWWTEEWWKQCTSVMKESCSPPVDSVLLSSIFAPLLLSFSARLALLYFQRDN